MNNRLLLVSSVMIIVVALCVRGSASHQSPSRQSRDTFSDVSRLIPPSCDFCHGWDRRAHKSGFYTGSYEALLDGAFKRDGFQPVILPGNAKGSPLIEYIEGRRKPRMPYKREPLSEEEIRLFRDWIDAGAGRGSETYEEHELSLPNVPIDAKTHAFWLSCGSRANEVSQSQRVKVIDERTNEVVAYEWPDDDAEEFRSNGNWNQWRVVVPQTVAGPVTVKLLVAGIMFHRSETTDSQDPADGTVFVIDSTRTSRSELDEIARAVLAPTPPPHRSLELKVRLLAEADLALSIYPTRTTKPVFSRSDPDLPKGTNTVRWVFEPTLPAPGWYEARFRFKARRPGTRQPDIGLMFEIRR